MRIRTCPSSSLWRLCSRSGIEPALGVVVVVLDAGVARRLGGAGDDSRRAERVRVAARVDAAPGVDGPALGEAQDPLGLVELLVVGDVAGIDDEVHRAGSAAARRHGAGRRERVDLADHRVVDVRVERLPGAPGGVHRRPRRVDELDPRRALLIGELEVGELAEVGDRGTALRPSGGRLPDPPLADRVGLTGAERQGPKARPRNGRIRCSTVVLPRIPPAGDAPERPGANRQGSAIAIAASSLQPARLLARSPIPCPAGKVADPGRGASQSRPSPGS